MAKARSPSKPYSKKEQEYIQRVAGKVPLDVIASQINRNSQSVMNWASKHGISLRVPKEIINKHWKEYAYARNKAAMQE